MRVVPLGYVSEHAGSQQVSGGFQPIWKNTSRIGPSSEVGQKMQIFEPPTPSTTHDGHPQGDGDPVAASGSSVEAKILPTAIRTVQKGPLTILGSLKRGALTLKEL